MARTILQFLVAAALAVTASLGKSDCIFLSPTPRNLNYYPSDSECLQMRVTGRTSGPLWGSTVYTSDSDIATAAVHAGVLKEDETGLIKLQMMPGQGSYSSSSQRGVRSASWDEYHMSYRFLDDQSSEPPQDLTDAWFRYRGQVQPILLTGNERGSVVGGLDGFYTISSDPGTAAVHAGALRPGETRPVPVWLLQPTRQFLGSERNGIWSDSLLTVDRVGAFGFPGVSQVVIRQAPPDLSTYRAPNGTFAWFRLARGSQGGGTVCGTDVYSVNSDLHTAAIHAGRGMLVGFVELKVVFVTVTEPFQGSERNGVMSVSCGGSLGFRFD